MDRRVEIQSRVYGITKALATRSQGLLFRLLPALSRHLASGLSYQLYSHGLYPLRSYAVAVFNITQVMFWFYVPCVFTVNLLVMKSSVLQLIYLHMSPYSSKCFLAPRHAADDATPWIMSSSCA